MSGQNDDDKDIQKALPLDLARSQITAGKGPLVMTGQSLRGMRVLQGALTTSTNTSVGGQTIITTNIVPQAVLKQDSGRAQLGIITSTQGSNQQGNLTIQQRPAQITLSAPLVNQTGASYHVPRGPAVVASLATNRSNVTTGHGFVRPPRTPSPAQATAWLTTSSSNGGQIKGATTVLSSPVRGATVTGKPQIVGRAQSGAVSTIRPGTILQNAIIAQPTQIHPYKPGASTIQTIGSSVTIAQVLPSRTQAVVYSANTGSQFPSTRLTVASNLPNQRQNQGVRPIGQVATARLTVPVNVATSGARLVAPQTVLTSGARISAVQSPQQQQQGARIVCTQPSAPLGRLTVATPTVVSANNVLGTRISALNLSNISSLVAVANSPQQRGLQTQGPKVITQPTQAIHLTSLQSPLKTTTQNVVSTSTRTISVPAAIVTQRQTTVVPSQAISIAKVFPSGDNQVSGTPANVFIHAPVQTTPKRMSPNPSAVHNQQHQQVSQGGGNATLAPTTTVATAYSLPTGTYFYDAAGTVARSFAQQQQPHAAPHQLQQQATPFAQLSQSGQLQQQIRPAAHAHGTTVI
ncbi:unnamed protein product [Brassicogethes aeneus]|uniref:Uncharacterized protein n=1 Tax=Brassicogethes aeneus TaxID=1431903 RepID=A0A9P0BA66_BRAAE|nr:unnamed protein product [Brassicogethes aeneus]